MNSLNDNGHPSSGVARDKKSGFGLSVEKPKSKLDSPPTS